MTLIAVLALFIILAAWRTRPGTSDIDQDAPYQRAHAAAKKYRQQRDDLQRRLTRRVLQLRHLSGRRLHQPDSLEAIRLASIAYGLPVGLLQRRARCETGGSFSRYARNSSSGASGLLQFLPSTWTRTPYAEESIWSPYANALAGAWMERQGRGGEWTCP